MQAQGQPEQLAFFPTLSEIPAEVSDERALLFVRDSDESRHRRCGRGAYGRQACWRSDRLARAIGHRGPRAADAPRVDLAGLETRMRAKLADWLGLLKRNVTEARGVLRALLVGPLKFTPITDERRRGDAFGGHDRARSITHWRSEFADDGYQRKGVD